MKTSIKKKFRFNPIKYDFEEEKEKHISFKVDKASSLLPLLLTSKSDKLGWCSVNELLNNESLEELFNTLFLPLALESLNNKSLEELFKFFEILAANKSSLVMDGWDNKSDEELFICDIFELKCIELLSDKMINSYGIKTGYSQYKENNEFDKYVITGDGVSVNELRDFIGALSNKSDKTVAIFITNSYYSNKTKILSESSKLKLAEKYINLYFKSTNDGDEKYEAAKQMIFCDEEKSDDFEQAFNNLERAVELNYLPAKWVYFNIMDKGYFDKGDKSMAAELKLKIEEAGYIIDRIHNSDQDYIQSSIVDKIKETDKKEIKTYGNGFTERIPVITQDKFNKNKKLDIIHKYLNEYYTEALDDLLYELKRVQYESKLNNSWKKMDEWNDYNLFNEVCNFCQYLIIDGEGCQCIDNKDLSNYDDVCEDCKQNIDEYGHFCSKNCQDRIFLCGQAYPVLVNQMKKCSHTAIVKEAIHHDCKGDINDVVFKNEDKTFIKDLIKDDYEPKSRTPNVKEYYKDLANYCSDCKKEKLNGIL
ncbi:5347_t:CDS:2 [Funneliformis caledonium]|uniref:5347_t:CDS:1 n=1 Tax=Funneliformis caledonium TaxID=1117310 RepID=A0A9N9BT75_9GLOM|nr:5347_t:CDS:2 [Funneliformis caledonium]